VSSALASQKATRTAVEASRGSQEHKALLELYALDSRLAASHARVADLTAAAAKLKRERAALRSELSAARITLASAQGRLALQLRTLYEQGHVDPLAVMFGATSLSQGMRKLDDLRHVADTSSRVVGATRAAEHRLLHARRTLAAHAKRLAGLLVAARAADQSLSSAAASKAAYVASLRAPDKAELLSTAQAATDKSQTIGHSKPPPPPPTGGRKMVADATCYILKGITASGLPVGPGIVAVDPTVIPLGTRLYIPGYGKGIAADIGGGIKGNIIDLWYPTYAACAKWGRRTVTITVY
jgi:3D (Asp-Asp-Asp) domain-containing protein/peptidoglycan hydrolase CwlO-like protein